MKESEAIKRIKVHLEWGFNKGTTEALHIAILAIEKQIPKKPKIYKGNEEAKDRLACCPICYSNVDWTYNGYWRKGKPNYCRECGQKIDWSGEDDK